MYYSTPETLATIYSDDSGTEQANPVLTDTLGNVTIFADTEYLYDVIVYDSNDNLLFGKKHIAPSSLLSVSSKVEAGDGINVTKTVSEGQITYTVSCDFDIVATQEELAEKQDKLQAGDNIEITDQNKINVVDRKQLIVANPLKMDFTNDKAILSINAKEEWVDYRNSYVEYTNTVASDTITFSNVLYVAPNTKIIAQIHIPNLVFNPYGTFGNGQVEATLFDDSDNIIWKQFYPLWSADMSINFPVLFENKSNNIEHLYLSITTTTNQNFAIATRRLYFCGGMANLI